MLQVSDLHLSEEEFGLLRDLVYEQTGIALKDAKLPLLRSRLIKRVRHHGFESFAEYYDLLRNHDSFGDELQHMINAVTTNKTSFFREAHHFDLLEKYVLAPARKKALRGYAPSIRIWSAGCSSGEEPYSIAMTVAMKVDHFSGWDLKILATDIDTEMLDRGRAGIYPRESIAEMSEAMQSLCFLSGTGNLSASVCVKPNLRHLITFARLNLNDATWPIRGGFDAIFCRNVMIYFDRESQQRLVERFAKCLKPGGVLFSGHSENLFWLGDTFEPVGTTAYCVRAKGRGDN